MTPRIYDVTGTERDMAWLRLLRLCETMMVSSWTPEQIVARAARVIELALEQ